MRHIIFAILLSLITAIPAFAADSGAELNLKDDQIFLVKNNGSTPLDQNMFPAQPIDGTDMRFLGVGPDDAAEQGIAAGLYIFKGNGRPVAFASTDEAEFCADVRFSPNKKILAMDAGTSHVRNWVFFSYPQMELLGDVTYYQTPDNPELVWVGEDGVLFSNMNESGHGRSCGYDPCGPVSVSYYMFETQKSSRLLSGTDLCDYTLTGLDETGLVATAAELCLPSAKAWEEFPEGKPVKAVTAKLP
ncbi:hypothetical protein LJC48_07965 [Desulfovibrio sp. OttesenSCG-928-C06]|nr:hypothetical protein [Desulfovibrio sp. OttesenSCG-928-C06]